MPKSEPISYTDAETHLSSVDRTLKKLIETVGPCTLQPNPNTFETLARSIISQQISTKAAESIRKRVVAVCGKGGLRPKQLLAASDADLRGAGLSQGKLRSLRSLSEFFAARPALTRQLKAMDDEEVIETLLPIRGIGRWTAQMFLMFSLGRLDVLPVGDLGFQLGVQDQYGLDELPKAAALEELAEPWRPYRSIATWYMWRSRDLK